jgi:ParB family chromosome partitioning protein
MNNYQVDNIPLVKIFNNTDFNCRGNILPIDVADLVKDIEQNGLQFPIAVQPRIDVLDLPNNYDYQVIAGHRRFEACKILKHVAIPAMIKVDLTEAQARLINLNENLKRKNLNILQEARAIERLAELMSQEDVAAALGMSNHWAAVRIHLLRLPAEIQEAAAAGILNQYQIDQIYSLPDREAQFAAVKKIKNARLRGEKGVEIKGIKDQVFRKKRQSKTAVQEMINHIGESIGYNLATRALSWANGQTSSAELFFDIQKFAKENNINYIVPIGDYDA